MKKLFFVAQKPEPRAKLPQFPVDIILYFKEVTNGAPFVVVFDL
jgi:hypothetical protein